MTTVTVPLAPDDQHPHGATLDVPAEPVCAGLAITPSIDRGVILDGWWSLIHTPSGLRVSGWKRTCRKHIDALAKVYAASGIDWTQDADTIKADERARALHLDAVFDFGPCDSDLHSALPEVAA